MGTASTLLAVIIPYFQTEGGILRRALHSVWAQALPAEAILEVIVVDDGSPAPVAPEVGGLQSTDAVRLRVISTPERGGVGGEEHRPDRRGGPGHRLHRLPGL